MSTRQPDELIDIGVNLRHASFGRDRDEVIARAVAAGVRTMIVTGTSEGGSASGLELVDRHPETLVSTVGVHPHNAKQCDDATIGILRRMAGHPRAVAIGECGLDFNRDFSPRPVQERWFEAQVELACELGKPLFLHERDAHVRLVDLLRPYRGRLVGAVVHCFTGTLAELEAYLDLDLHIGITGWICDERRGTHLRELVGRIPANRLMVETDAPFLHPRNLKPQPADRRNEPATLPHIVQEIARATGRTHSDVAESTTRTARAFFGLDAMSVGEGSAENAN